jgi:UDP-N-acetylmuramate--alanine ligase
VEQSDEDMTTVHFVGIGGAGMSGIARLLLARGFAVTGSDAQESAVTRALQREGAVVHIGHDAAYVVDAARVVYSAAIPPENPELAEAARRGIPLVRRDVALGELMRESLGIAIAGTHGKTTTTGMVTAIFLQAGLDPSVLIGGDLPLIGGNARVGAGPHLISEACEAYDSFLALEPRIAAVTNVEADHLDYHGSLAGVVGAFQRFVARIPPDGCAVLNADDPHTPELQQAARCRVLRFGLNADADLVAEDVEIETLTPRFRVRFRGERLGEVCLAVPGRHNVSNALAALGVALEAGIPFAAARDGLAAFTGTGRRFETLGEVGGVRVIDDYAHHPTEVAANLTTARAVLRRPLTAVFQPHLYSRTRDQMQEFARSFAPADRVIITDIYAAREAPIPGVDAGQLAEAIRQREPSRDVHYIPRKEEIAPWLAERVMPGEVVLVLGAGDVRRVGEHLVELLGKQANN